MPATITRCWSDNGWNGPIARSSCTSCPPTPQLNAIERLWGVMHREVTHKKFYQSFAQFTETIDSFFAERLPKQRPIWRDTVTDNFRITSHQEFRVLK